jgi:hypothetical protein
LALASESRIRLLSTVGPAAGAGAGAGAGVLAHATATAPASINSEERRDRRLMADSPK